MKLISFIFSFLFFQSLAAQTADDIIQKYTSAMGGLDAFNKIESARITGTLKSQGKNYPLTVQIKNGKSMRSDVDVNGQIVTNAYDKGKGWKLNPYEGITKAVELTSNDDILPLKLQTSLANNLMDYKKRGHQVVLAGEEDIEGQKAYKIQLTSKDDGKLTTYYISSRDYLMLRSDSKQKVQGTDYDAQTFYSAFTTIDGLKFSMHFVRKIQGIVFQEVNYSKVELNVPIDEKTFKMPD